MMSIIFLKIGNSLLKILELESDKIRRKKANFDYINVINKKELKRVKTLIVNKIQEFQNQGASERFSLG